MMYLKIKNEQTNESRTKSTWTEREREKLIYSNNTIPFRTVSRVIIVMQRWLAENAIYDQSRRASFFFCNLFRSYSNLLYVQHYSGQMRNAYNWMKLRKIYHIRNTVTGRSRRYAILCRSHSRRYFNKLSYYEPRCIMFFPKNFFSPFNVPFFVA